MVSVRNNKTANVTLPAGKGSICFKPGTHEYREDDLDEIDTSRAAVRAYLEPQGNKPAVLEILDEDYEPGDDGEEAELPVAELVPMIKASEDLDWLENIVVNDSRKTAREAAVKRHDELTEAAKPTEANAAGADANTPDSGEASGDAS